MKMKIAFIVSVVLPLLTWNGLTSAGSTDEIVVIANKANPVKAVSREELRPLFQTTKADWSDGAKAEPINLPDDSALRQTFDVAVLGLDPDRVARYWVDRRIRGGERPPRKASPPSVVVRAVAGNRGAVGYVSPSDANDTVKVIARIRNGQVVSP